MNKLIIVAALLSLTACDEPSVQKFFGGNPEPAARATQPASDEVVIGKGQILKAKDIEVILGPTSVYRTNANIPFLVRNAPSIINGPEHIIACMSFDAAGRLVASSSGPLPPKTASGQISFTVSRPISRTTCELLHV